MQLKWDGTLDLTLFSDFHILTGTVVKRKKGTFLADLARPGDAILVARGGQGGVSIDSFYWNYEVLTSILSPIRGEKCLEMSRSCLNL